MSKKPRKSKKKKLFTFIILLLIAGALVFVALKIPRKTAKTEENKKKVVDEIENFDYKVSETDTKLFKSEFKKLKTILSKKEVDNKEYAQAVAKLFVIDFYTLDNKMTKNDVGGVQFVYNNYKASFIDKARDEFYKYLKSNLDNNRTQSLPVVSEITVDSAEQVSASSELSGSEFASIEEAYKVRLSWDYKTDLGYQKSATVIVVKDNDKFTVAKLTE